MSETCPFCGLDPNQEPDTGFTIHDLPPGVNHCYAPDSRYPGVRHRTLAFDEWIEQAELDAAGMDSFPLQGWIRMSVGLWLPNRRSDVDGFAKVILDGLQEPTPPKHKGAKGRRGVGVYENDRQIRDLRIFEAGITDRPRVDLRFWVIRK